ncbi:hypothetical protein [Nocardia heshunensis]
MGTNIAAILYMILQAVRYIGILVLIIASMAILISEAAKNKLSPAKILTVVGSAIIAALLFWALPNLIYFARSDTIKIVPDRQIGPYGQ